jgi:Peptidase family M28
MMKGKLVLLLVCFMAINSINAQYVGDVITADPAKRISKSMDKPMLKFSDEVKLDELKTHLYKIASAEMGGREPGSEGMNKAETYITDLLKKHKVSFAPGLNSYYQPVEFTFSSWEDPKITAGEKEFKHLWDFASFPNKTNEVLGANINKVHLLGYGIEHKSMSNYPKKTADLKGSTAIILHGEPKDGDGNSIVDKSVSESDWTTNIDLKIGVAKKYGIQNLLVVIGDVRDFVAKNRGGLLRPSSEMKNTLGKKFDTPNVIYISKAMAAAILGQTEEEVSNFIEKGTSSETNFVLNLKKKQYLIKGNNIAAYFKGSKKADEVVVLSAHHDHVGQKGEEIFYGADDNGTGTVALMEIAESLALAEKAGKMPERSILVLWVTAEEKGLLGSKYYVENPILPIEKTVADINIDMIGRNDKKYTEAGNTNYVYVIGADRISKELHEVNVQLNDQYSDLTLDYTYNSDSDPNRFYFRADHYSFASKGIPAVFFFTGVHDDYHKTTDTPDKIDFTKYTKITQHIFNVAWEIADRKERLKITEQVK